MNVSIKIGGVPEHFNYLFKLALERGIDKKYNINFEFIDQKCGTGAMLDALKNKKLDIIIALTEGIVADIVKGSNIKILGTYVKSKLCWAISIKNDSKIKSIDELKNKTFAISRKNSGSHLMVNVLAKVNKWNPSDLKFKVIGNFEKLRNSISNEETDAFLWEKFTTKPYHDNNSIKKLDEINTPWSSFMIASLDENIKNNKDIIKKLLLVMNEAANIFKLENVVMPYIIAKEYQLKKKDALEWYNSVDIVANNEVSKSNLELTIKILKESDIIDKNKNVDINLFIDNEVTRMIG
jgi:sulfonate transport system substrate-binding protein